MSRDTFEWFSEDARMVEEEAEDRIAAQKAFLAREEALTELDGYFMGMSVEAVETALQGMRDYARAVQAERSIVMGWERFTDG